MRWRLAKQPSLLVNAASTAIRLLAFIDALPCFPTTQACNQTPRNLITGCTRRL